MLLISRQHLFLLHLEYAVIFLFRKQSRLSMPPGKHLAVPCCLLYTSCSASGTVKAEGNEPVGLGGIGGCLEMMDSITNCTADVTIESANGGHAIGGLCGYAGTHSNPDVCLETEGFSTKNYPSVIDNCKITVSIKADGATHVGGLIGTGLYYYGEETVFKAVSYTHLS